jgi:hypothetical protein
MTFITRSLPREAEDPPPDPPTRLELLQAEHRLLASKVRRGIRSRHQERILRRIAEITRAILTLSGAGQ